MKRWYVRSTDEIWMTKEEARDKKEAMEKFNKKMEKVKAVAGEAIEIIEEAYFDLNGNKIVTYRA